MTSDSSDHIVFLGRSTDGGARCKAFMVRKDTAVIISGMTGQDGYWDASETVASIAAQIPAADETLEVIAGSWGMDLIRRIRASGQEQGIVRGGANLTLLDAMFVQNSATQGVKVFSEHIVSTYQGDHTLALSEFGETKRKPNVGEPAIITGGSGGDDAFANMQELSIKNVDSDVLQMRNHIFTKANMVSLSTKVAGLTIKKSLAGTEINDRLAYPVQMIYAGSNGEMEWIERGPCK